MGMDKVTRRELIIKAYLNARRIQRELLPDRIVTDDRSPEDHANFREASLLRNEAFQLIINHFPTEEREAIIWELQNRIRHGID